MAGWMMGFTPWQIVGLVLFLVAGGWWVRSAGDHDGAPAPTPTPSQPWPRWRKLLALFAALAFGVVVWGALRPDQPRAVWRTVRNWIPIGRTPGATARQFMERLAKSDVPTDLVEGSETRELVKFGAPVFDHRFEFAYPCVRDGRDFLLLGGRLESLNGLGMKVWFNFALVVENRRNGAVWAFRSARNVKHAQAAITGVVLGSGAWKPPTEPAGTAGLITPIASKTWEHYDSSDDSVGELAAASAELSMVGWPQVPLPTDAARQ